MAFRVQGIVIIETRRAITQLRSLNREARAVGTTAATEFARADRSLGSLSRTAQFARQHLFSVAAAIASVLSARKAIDTLIEYEKALVGVGKTTKVVGIDLAELGGEFVNLSREVPIATAELLGMGKAAGQLGVRGTSNLRLFAKTAGELQSATVLLGDEAITSLARILNVTGEAHSSVDRLGASLVALGNRFAANEREILKTGTAVAQNTAIFNVSAADALAFGTVLASMGIKAEIGGTTFGRAMRVIDNAAREGGQSLTILSSVTGLTADEFQRLARTDASAAMSAFLSGLDRIAASGGSVVAVLRALNLGDIRLLRTLPTLAIRHEEVARALDVSSRSHRENRESAEEAGRAFATLGSRLQAFANVFTAIIARQDQSAGSMSRWLDTAGSATAILGGVSTEGDRASRSARGLATAIEALTTAAAAFIATRVAFHLGAMAASAALTVSPLTAAAAGIGLLAGALALIPERADNADEALARLRQRITDLEGVAESIDRLRIAEDRAISLGKFGEAARIASQRATLLADTSVALRANLAEIEGAGASAAQAAADISKLRIEAVDLVKRGADAADAWKKLREALGATSRTVDQLQRIAPALDVDALRASTIDGIRRAIKEAGDDPQALRIVLGTIDLDPGTALADSLQKFQSLVDRQLAGETRGFANLGAAIRDQLTKTLADPGLAESIRIPIAQAIAVIESQIGDAEAAAVRFGQRAKSATDPAGDSIERLIELYQDAESAAESAQRALFQELQTLDERVALLRIEAREGKVAAEVERLRTLAKRGLITATEDQIEAIRKLLQDEESLQRQLSGDLPGPTRGQARTKDPSFAGGFGFEAGAFITEVQDAFAAGERLAGSTAQAMAASFDTFLFDVLTGKFESVGDAIRGLGATLGQALIRVGTQELAAQAVAGIGSLAGLGGAAAPAAALEAGAAASAVTLEAGGGAAAATLGAGAVTAATTLEGGAFLAAGAIDTGAGIAATTLIGAGTAVAAEITGAAIFAAAILAAGGGGGIPIGVARRGAIFAGPVAKFRSGGSFRASRAAGLVKSPTLFRFGAGANELGVAGEAGPEAIVPVVPRGGSYAIRAQSASGEVQLLDLTRIGGRVGVQLPTAFQDGGVFPTGFGGGGGRPGDPSSNQMTVVIHQTVNVDRGADEAAVRRGVAAGSEEMTAQLRRELGGFVRERQIHVTRTNTRARDTIRRTRGPVF